MMDQARRTSAAAPISQLRDKQFQATAHPHAGRHGRYEIMVRGTLRIRYMEMDGRKHLASGRISPHIVKSEISTG
jgi:hypothetical protein